MEYIDNSSKPKYKRILIKLSGEALKGIDGNSIIDEKIIDKIGRAVSRCHELGVEVAIIVGAGNIWRGASGTGMDRTRADHMGMLATTINALALQDAFIRLGMETRVMTAISMQEIAEPYIRNRAVHHLDHGRVIIFGCGIGNPFFTTDTAAVMRAAEIGADIVILAKNIDAVYDSDPRRNRGAKKLDVVDYKYILNNELTVIDSTAASFSKDNSIPLLICALRDPDNIVRAVMGEKIGTLVTHTNNMNT